MRRTLCALFIMSAVSVGVLSADTPLQGLWAGQVQGDSGPQAIEMSFALDGPRVGGVVTSDQREFGIREVSFDGSVLEFNTYQGSDNTGVKLHWTGVVNGNEITFSYRTDDQQTTPLEFVMHHQDQ
jgi:hypothetical protein